MKASEREKVVKKAVLIGCNYPETKAELRGCINDVKRMRRWLVERYGFDDEDITVLIGTDDSYAQPTGKNIRDALSLLIRSAGPGDLHFVHYSGRDARLPSETGEDDECIGPCDTNLITGPILISPSHKPPDSLRLEIAPRPPKFQPNITFLGNYRCTVLM